jgi:hypothetical protein
VGPVLAVVLPWFPVPAEPLPVGLPPVLPVAGALDVGDEDADEGGVTGLELTGELTGAGGGVETAGLTV